MEMRYVGYNGQISVEADTLILSRDDMVARLTFGPRQPRRIPLRAITGCRLKKASVLRNGWLQLMLGGIEAKPLSMGNAASNNNTVLFTHKNRGQFQAIHAWLESVAAINNSGGLTFDPTDVDDAAGIQVRGFDNLGSRTEVPYGRQGRHRAPKVTADPTPRRRSAGLFKRFVLWHRRGRLAPTPLAPTPLAPTPLAPTPLAPTPLAPTYLPPVGAGFAVVDVETTGLSASWDRVVEIAVIHTDGSGRVTDEWTTLINPERTVGATRIHLITAADVRRAPRFADVAGELAARLSGRALVAHNARFDLAFLRHEYARAGWDMPESPHLCTLDASWIYLPNLSRRRLPDCCWAMGIQLDQAHSALGDARGTAALLASYLDPRRPPQHQHTQLPFHASQVSWPSIPRTPVNVALRGPTRPNAEPAAPGKLATLLDALPLSSVLEEGAPEVAKAYVELLAEALEDGILTDAEADLLGDLARTYALTRQQVDAAHRGLLLALAHKAVEDGKITRVERADLLATAAVFGFPDGIVKAVLNEADAELTQRRSHVCQPLPGTWQHGEPLRIRQRVAFTGCDDLERARLERRAQDAGLRVTGSVSRQTTVLVTDGVNPDTTKAKTAREIGTRTVTPAVFAELVAFVQPFAAADEAALPPAKTSPVRRQRFGGATNRATVDLSTIEPSAIRAWARQQGQEIGERGRLPAGLIAAYKVAHNSSEFGN